VDLDKWLYWRSEIEKFINNFLEIKKAP
jgi:hypothetical protein